MRFLADENFSGRTLRGLRLREPTLDVIRVQDTELYGKEDDKVLAWAAEQNRILLTHDARTMPKFAYERLEKNQPMPGVIVVNDQAPIGTVIDDILIAIGASEPEEFENAVKFIPL